VTLAILDDTVHLGAFSTLFSLNPGMAIIAGVDENELLDDVNVAVLGNEFGTADVPKASSPVTRAMVAIHHPPNCPAPE
jgi:hypothetical protein